MQIRQHETEKQRSGPIEEYLHSIGQPAKIISLDGKEVIDAVEIKKGVAYFENYKKTSNAALLAVACDKGCFKSLIVRANIHKAIIMSANHQEDEKNAAAEALLRDLDRMSNLYWSVGQIHASRVLLRLGDYFNQNNDPARAAIYWQKSASMFYMAKLLMRVDISDHIREIIYQGRDYTASGYKSVAEAEDTTTSHLAPDDKNQLLSYAQNRVKDMIDHHPCHPKFL